jgi:hypothetical protein
MSCVNGIPQRLIPFLSDYNSTIVTSSLLRFSLNDDDDDDDSLQMTMMMMMILFK